MAKHIALTSVLLSLSSFAPSCLNTAKRKQCFSLISGNATPCFLTRKETNKLFFRMFFAGRFRESGLAIGATILEKAAEVGHGQHQMGRQPRGLVCARDGMPSHVRAAALCQTVTFAFSPAHRLEDRRLADTHEECNAGPFLEGSRLFIRVDVEEHDSIQGVFLSQAAKVIMFATTRHCFSQLQGGGGIRDERKRKKARVARMRVAVKSSCDSRHTKYGVSTWPSSRKSSGVVPETPRRRNMFICSFRADRAVCQSHEEPSDEILRQKS